MLNIVAFVITTVDNTFAEGHVATGTHIIDVAPHVRSVQGGWARVGRKFHGVCFVKKKEQKKRGYTNFKFKSDVDDVFNYIYIT